MTGKRKTKMPTEKKWNVYRGDNIPHNDIAKLPEAPSWRGNSTKTKKAFRPMPEEIDLVNTALCLRRPLLITGKPGTGKSALAKAVAEELQLGEVLSWHITTQSTLKDALYSYDAVARLHDASIEKGMFGTSKQENIGKYITLGAIGTAFADSMHKKIRVILIDEIDKSDIDLPNNLLHVLEENRFKIPELERSVDKKHQVRTLDEKNVEIEKGSIIAEVDYFPLIIMTSNDEREFPPAFLRRCIHLTMKERTDFKELENIIASHIELDEDSKGKLESLIKEFIQQEKEGKYHSIDQLLNTVFLRLKGIEILEEENEHLLKSIWKSLSV